MAPSRRSRALPRCGPGRGRVRRERRPSSSAILWPGTARPCAGRPILPVARTRRGTAEDLVVRDHTACLGTPAVMGEANRTYDDTDRDFRPYRTRCPRETLARTATSHPGAHMPRQGERCPRSTLEPTVSGRPTDRPGRAASLRPVRGTGLRCRCVRRRSASSSRRCSPAPRSATGTCGAPRWSCSCSGFRCSSRRWSRPPRIDTLAGRVAGHARVPALPGRPVLLRHPAEQPVPVLRRLPRARRVEHRDALPGRRPARVRLAACRRHAGPVRRRVRARDRRDERRRLALSDRPGAAELAIRRR